MSRTMWGALGLIAALSSLACSGADAAGREEARIPLDDAKQVWVQQHDGSWSHWISGAPDFVNRDFIDRYAPTPTPTPTATAAPLPPIGFSVSGEGPMDLPISFTPYPLQTRAGRSIPPEKWNYGRPPLVRIELRCVVSVDVESSARASFYAAIIGRVDFRTTFGPYEPLWGARRIELPHAVFAEDTSGTWTSEQTIMFGTHDREYGRAAHGRDSFHPAYTLWVQRAGPEDNPWSWTVSCRRPSAETTAPSSTAEPEEPQGTAWGFTVSGSGNDPANLRGSVLGSERIFSSGGRYDPGYLRIEIDYVPESVTPEVALDCSASVTPWPTTFRTPFKVYLQATGRQPPPPHLRSSTFPAGQSIVQIETQRPYTHESRVYVGDPAPTSYPDRPSRLPPYVLTVEAPRGDWTVTCQTP